MMGFFTSVIDEICFRQTAGADTVRCSQFNADGDRTHAETKTLQSSFIFFSMLLGLVMSPRIQDKVHLELDAIVGPGRLPTPEDIPFLAYLQAVFMEALRWRPVLPLGVPRRGMANDEYMGYSIPAGTVILPVRFLLVQ